MNLSGLIPTPNTTAALTGLPASARTAAKAAVPADIREAADGFESLFVMQLLEPLEKSGEAMFGKGPEGRTVGGLYREQLSTQIAKARPIGVAELIERELLARRDAGIVDTAPGAGAVQESTHPDAARRAAELYRKAIS